jgi:hypothetical protein
MNIQSYLYEVPIIYVDLLRVGLKYPEDVTWHTNIGSLQVFTQKNDYYLPW